MSQPAANPFHLANIVSPALDGLLGAIASRGNPGPAERAVRATQALTMILSFQPRDVVELMVSGQAVLFNEVLADGARDVLMGMTETMKARSHVNLVNIGRVMQGHLDRLNRMGNQPARTELADPAGVELNGRAPVQEPAIEPATAPRPPAPAPAPPVQARAAADPGTGSPAAAIATPEQPVSETETGDCETSWLDEPFVQWIIETPADAAARLARTAAASGSDPYEEPEPGLYSVPPAPRVPHEMSMTAGD